MALPVTATRATSATKAVPQLKHRHNDPMLIMIRYPDISGSRLQEQEIRAPERPSAIAALHYTKRKPGTAG